MRGFLLSPPSFADLAGGALAPAGRRAADRGPASARRSIWLMLGAAAALATLSLVVSAQTAEGRSLKGRPHEPNAAAAEATGAVSPAVRRGGFDETSESRPNRGARALARMREGGGVRPPYGYERFCARDAAYCAPPEKRQPGASVTASPALIKRLAAFNRSVNAEFEPNEDRAVYGVSDLWTFPSVYADCEDYVLVKQARLLEAGWPRESLLIGVVVGEQSPFHAVLIVRTSMGELVLDNMTDELLDWRDTGYSFVIRQSTELPERWVRVLPAKDGADG